jgi:glutaminyl-tRNA synthetase
MREHLNEVAPRRMAVLDPVKLVIDNFPPSGTELASVPNHPQKPDWGKREVPFSRELWIERDDFARAAEGLLPALPGNEVRLRFGYVVKCTGIDNGVVHCTYHPTRSPAPRRRQVQGERQHPLGERAPRPRVRRVHLYDRLFGCPTRAPSATSSRISTRIR